MIRAVLQGEGGPLRDVVLLNAAAALFIAGRVASVREGLVRAGAAIDSGDAIKTLEALVRLSQPSIEAGRGRSTSQAAGA
jgi:anthranilate phosphoribosyltransferase